jgi:hypothetical protein
LPWLSFSLANNADRVFKTSDGSSACYLATIEQNHANCAIRATQGDQKDYGWGFVVQKNNGC